MARGEVPRGAYLVTDHWLEVRDQFEPAKLLFRYDPKRGLVEVVRGGVRRIVDLTQVVKQPLDKQECDHVDLS